MAHLKLSALVFVAAAAQAAGQEWEQVPNTTTHINISRIRKISTNEYEVWERVVLTEKVLEYVRSQGHGAEYSDYAHTTALIRIQCDTKRWGALKVTNYNSKGDPLAPSILIPERELQMEAATPGTYMDIVLDFACARIAKASLGGKK